MKKILSLLGTITLIGTSTTSLVACNTSQYSEEQLKKQKEKYKIDTKDGILEWIAPQEKPFNQIDNKWYFVVWKTNNWNITKFKNNTLINRWHPSIEIDNKNEDENYKLNLEWIRGHGTIVIRSYSVISDWPAPRFKTIYRWNLDTNMPNLIVGKDGIIKVN
ncbi:MAG: hypothetical protein EIB84_07195 [Spiroplasma poulsonii]|uniref:Lipoprotein n=2 Tax=Spiroplasma poulsonii TaxID=2138 RepID=A0A2P6FG86_9MOLU|nr:lipoprotein [Spiroplasma poulsonii]KAF0849830.1 putative lipoprotein [Spiroplasma poulsonii]KAF0849974.1 putative lipoprotein [Spiroplasma poulsonii]MBW1242518.1 hypothetical protein [Spiroplasma poulsonii]PQM32468.1 hypothetical protein SMSRO_SF023890 [Spiroplasma poulsonii]PWF95134.1 hypothetical protein SMSE_05590 [Spiroplasma poulsonii]